MTKRAQSDMSTIAVIVILLATLVALLFVYTGFGDVIRQQLGYLLGIR